MRPHEPSPPDWNEWRSNVLVGDVRARTFDLRITADSSPTIERAGPEQRDVIDDLKPGAKLESALAAVFGDKAAAIARDVAARARAGRPMYVDSREAGYAAAFLPLTDGGELHMTGCVVAAGACD